jgi:sterol desaturase/sphingolipid hydroxylase (fatty acid hydroxylase superfamily)
VPVALWCLWYSLVAAGLSAGETALIFAGGLLVWTLAEYAIHRFVFHFEPKANHRTLERALFLFHGIHHVQPQIKSRLVMPPLVSVPLAALFYALFAVVVGSWLARPRWVNALFAGFIIGYVCYDMIHYATHHLPMRGRLMKALKRQHMQHHFQNPDERYGVSTPIWDVAFGTWPHDASRSQSHPK